MCSAPPLGYLAFLGLEAEASFVLTDSGGVQEETSALGVPCFTLRDTTERPVTVELGTNTRPRCSAQSGSLRFRSSCRTPRVPEPIPFWDGRAGERAAAVLNTFLGSRESATAA